MRRRNLSGLLIALLLVLIGTAIFFWPKGKLDMGLYHAQKIYDLGTGDPGDVIKSSVKLWNLGLKPITIEEVSACCGSTAKLQGGEKKKILPLHSAIVNVDMFIGSDKGSALKSIEVSMSRGKEKSFDYLLFQYNSTGEGKE